MLGNTLYWDRTLMYEAEIEDRVEALTVEQVNAVVRRYIDPAKMTVVKAGDFGGSG